MGYQEYRSRIDSSVFLLPVSKTKDYGMVLEAYREGARAFGENRIQEIEKKFPVPSERPEGMQVFLIGQLQKNKVRKAVYLCDRIESVDSLDLLLLIDKEARRIGRCMDVLLEYNSSMEEQKSGFCSSDDVLAVLSASLCMEGVRVIGLMTVGPLGFDRDKNLEAFGRTKVLFDRMKEISPAISVLSMGMSADYEEAIASGSTEVRIGSAIFGARG